MSEENQNDRAESPDDSSEKQHDNSRVPPQLKPFAFPPGQSGNPGGRPKGKTVMSAIREILEDDAEREAVARAYVDQMKGGAFQHLKEVIDREEGKVPDRLETKTVPSDEDEDFRGWLSERTMMRDGARTNN